MVSQSVPTLSVDLQRRVEREGALHHLVGEGGQDGQLLLIGLEDELVMDLQQHLRAQAALADGGVHADHGDLHAVGGRALDRHVDRHPLAGGTQRPVARGQLRQVAAPAEQRGHEALVAGQDPDLDRVAADARVGGEVVGDEALRLLARDLEPIRQPEVAAARRRCRS